MSPGNLGKPWNTDHIRTTVSLRLRPCDSLAAPQALCVRRYGLV